MDDGTDNPFREVTDGTGDRGGIGNRHPMPTGGTGGFRFPRCSTSGYLSWGPLHSGLVVKIPFLSIDALVSDRLGHDGVFSVCFGWGFLMRCGLLRATSRKEVVGASAYASYKKEETSREGRDGDEQLKQGEAFGVWHVHSPS